MSEMAAIQIKWLGHSCFRVECDGYAIVLDPFEPGSVPGCKDIQETADQVLCSHQHYDHNYTAGVTLRENGPENPFTVTALPSFHDDCQGSKRGPNTIHVLEAQGLRVAHFGDVGDMPSPEVLEQLKNLDAVMIPVGGFYTVGPKEAQAIVEAISPRVVIPMHYRSDTFGFDVLGTLEGFLEVCGRWVRCDTDTLEVTPGMSHYTALLTYGG
jgi:L-ascorbate metabolism protein UlaG (beta-lactamase superfamily)